VRAVRARRLVAVVSLAGAAVMVAGVGPGASASQHAKRSTDKVLAFRANGTPILTGMTIRMGNAAGSAHAADTNVHDLVGFLTKWGANASQTNASQNETELGVAAGSLDATAGPFNVEADAGLTAFGPNQARLDYVLLAKDAIKSISSLKGRTVAICCQSSPDYVLLLAALRQGSLTMSDIKLSETGASSSSLNELIAGQADAAFVHSDGPATAGPNYHVIANAAALEPGYADSFMAATPGWLKAHPAVAEAIDLAWLASAKLFNTKESTWVSNAYAYTAHADPLSLYKQTWQQLKLIDGWPTKLGTFTTKVVQLNLGLAKAQGAIQGQGNRPLSQLANVAPWQAAVAQFLKHEKAY